jgi:hypothetical protein
MISDKQIQKSETNVPKDVANAPEQNLEQLSKIKLEFDPDQILEKAVKESATGQLKIAPESNFYKALSLLEFDNGMLMTTVLSEQYKTLAIYLSRQLQAEYNCKGISEKATAELVAINYCRTLEIQRRVNNLLGKDGLSRIDLEFFSLLSKELDRCNRHYLSAIQTLKIIKQPQLQLNIKTDTAILGNNQLIQENRRE